MSEKFIEDELVMPELVDVVINEPNNRYVHGHIVRGTFDDFKVFQPWYECDVNKYAF